MNQEGTRLAKSEPFGHRASTKFDLNETVRQLAYLRQHEHHHHKIAVILDLDRELPKTAADGRQIECVLLTLFARSRKAIIEAKRPHGTIKVRTEVKAGKIQFSITDDGLADLGRGLSGALFTTTPEEDVNLTTCAEIVQDQAGEMYAWRPRHSVFTTVIVDLPADV